MNYKQKIWITFTSGGYERDIENFSSFGEITKRWLICAILHVLSIYHDGDLNM